MAGRIPMELITQEQNSPFHRAGSRRVCVFRVSIWDSWPFKHGTQCPCTNNCPISFKLFAFHSLPSLSLLFAPGPVTFHLFTLHPSFKVPCTRRSLKPYLMPYSSSPETCIPCSGHPLVSFSSLVTLWSPHGGILFFSLFSVFHCCT